jgi:hypothetical protein
VSNVDEYLGDRLVGNQRGQLVKVSQLTADNEARLMGPHLVDCREAFGGVTIDPDNWTAMARHVVAHGRGPGSLEDESTAGLDYHVLDADAVQRNLPALWDAYLAFTPKVSEILGREVVPSTGPMAVNVNIVQGVGGRYELHTDSQPFTLLLFATELHLGGELVVQHPTCGELRIVPKIGQAVLFDGSRLTNASAPYANLRRISIPMVYVDAEVGDVVPEDLAGYLHGDES